MRPPQFEIFMENKTFKNLTHSNISHPKFCRSFMNERHETLTVADHGNRAEIRIVAFFILSYFYRALLDVKKKNAFKSDDKPIINI